MIERGQHLRFAAETRHAVGIFGEEVGDDLDRYVAVELGVGRTINLAHSALADSFGDLVMFDGLAFHEITSQPTL